MKIHLPNKRTLNLLPHKDRSLLAAGNLLKAGDDWARTFDAVPDLIMIIDLDYRIQCMNSSMACRFGISREEVKGRHCHELLHCLENAYHACPHKRALDSGKVSSESWFDTVLNGHFVVTASPIYTQDGALEATIHVMHDVSELKRLNDELDRSHKLESIGLLAGGLSHEFNNVLNIIYGNITFAKMLAGDVSAIAEPLTDAEEACERAKEFGIRLRAFSLGSSPAKEPVELRTILEDAVGTVLEGSNIVHSVSATDDISPIEADPIQIRQVFENLLTNAKESMPGGGMVAVDIDSFMVEGNNELPLRSGPYARISLRDSGQGIREEDLPKVFDPYYSTKDSYSQRGLGLGLSICHTILKRHQGHIAIESKLGIGTEVTIYLPAGTLTEEASLA